MLPNLSPRLLLPYVHGRLAAESSWLCNRSIILIKTRSAFAVAHTSSMHTLLTCTRCLVSLCPPTDPGVCPFFPWPNFESTDFKSPEHPHPKDHLHSLHHHAGVRVEGERLAEPQGLFLGGGCPGPQGYGVGETRESGRRFEFSNLSTACVGITKTNGCLFL